MATIAERRKARREKSRAGFAAAGKRSAKTLAGIAETTAQRRGRVPDQLERVIAESVAPPAPPPPPPRPAKPKTICDVLGTRKVSRGTTFARGVSFVCGGIPIQFNAQANNTTRRFFGQSIALAQAKVRAAGLGSQIPKSPAEIAGAQRRRKILRRKQRSCGGNIGCITNFSKQIDAIEKEFRI